MQFIPRLMLFFTLSLSFSANADFSVDNSPVNLGALVFDAQALCKVAQAAEAYLAKGQAFDTFANHQGKVFENTALASQVTFKRVQQTLAFICTVYRQDIAQQQTSRLNDADFIKQHFQLIRWQPNLAQAKIYANKTKQPAKARLLNRIPSEELLLTKYYTKTLDASRVPTAKYNQALYALPLDEAGLSKAEADNNKALIRFNYSRQQIIAGALLNNEKVKPLIWLTEKALHDVLLQGTGVLNVDGQLEYYNVHRNNGIAYDYAIGKTEQARYWYFAKVPSIMGYGKSIESKIALQPQVSLAGNVADLGLGKLILLNYQLPSLSDGKSANVSRLAVLADQGGAFDNNLFQLDLLVDSYRGWKDYHQANKNLPDFAKVWILLKK